MSQLAPEHRENVEWINYLGIDYFQDIIVEVTVYAYFQGLKDGISTMQKGKYFH